MIGLGVPGAATGAGPRAEVWGLPWRSDVAFPGLALRCWPVWPSSPTPS